MTETDTPTVSTQLTPRPDVWALSWSQSQCALHVEPLAEMLSKNRTAYACNVRSDYVALHIGPREECDLAADNVRNTIKDRQQRRVNVH